MFKNHEDSEVTVEYGGILFELYRVLQPEGRGGRPGRMGCHKHQPPGDAMSMPSRFNFGGPPWVATGI